MVDLNLKSSLPWPLLSQVFVQLLYTLVLKLFALSLALGILEKLLYEEPLLYYLKSVLQDLRDFIRGKQEIRDHSLLGFWVTRWKLVGLLEEIVFDDICLEAFRLIICFSFSFSFLANFWSNILRSCIFAGDCLAFFYYCR